MDESTKLGAFAHLKNGLTPAEVSDLMPEVSYAQALRLRKELVAAEETNTLNQLFNMEDAAIELLLEAVQQKLSEPAEVLESANLVPAEINRIAQGVAGAQKLDVSAQQAAEAILLKIKLVAPMTANSETLVSLADALCKIQVAFFGPAGGPAGSDSNSPGSFEKYLRD